MEIYFLSFLCCLTFSYGAYIPYSTEIFNFLAFAYYIILLKNLHAPNGKNILHSKIYYFKNNKTFRI